MRSNFPKVPKSNNRGSPGNSRKQTRAASRSDVQRYDTVVEALADESCWSRLGIPSRRKGQGPKRLPRAVALGRAVTEYLQGRDCLFKDSSYIGPVHVDAASCSYRWVRVSFTTRPWVKNIPRERLWMVTPVSGTDANAFHIEFNAGYGISGMFIHAPAAIAALQKLRKDGGSLGDAICAMNTGQGLPEKVAALREQPFAGLRG